MANIITVDFHQDTLYAVERDDGVFVAIKSISDTLGLRWNGQLERLKRDTILAEGMRVMRIPTPGGEQETTLLKLELVNGWLLGVDEDRVKDEETRQNVLTYKRECYSVLFEHFYGKRRSKTQIDNAEEKPFPHWPMEEMRTKRGVVDLYRLTHGPLAAQWIMPGLGFPIPPIETIEVGRQGRFILVPQTVENAEPA